MRAKERNLTAEMVRQLLDYDPETGVFRWKARPVEMFAPKRFTAERECRRWNARYAGSVAGTIGAPHGYVLIKIIGSFHYAHRVAWLWMTGKWPSSDIDHINLGKSDNRWTNLREASRAQNCSNRRLRSDNSTGFKGVSWSNQHGAFTANFMTQGKSIFLGLFSSAEEAHAAYVAAAIKHNGQFARVK